VKRGDLAPVTLEAHRQILNSIWRPQIGTLSLWAVRYSKLVEMADAHRRTKKSSLRLADSACRVRQAAANSAGVRYSSALCARAWCNPFATRP
jgi:hypothetical protein